ncbi:MAG: hypothetical protein HC893_10185 [Chloroflexaceae bacterium]|nr:hypothetical protein [Chloroflexaceae bacterium]
MPTARRCSGDVAPITIFTRTDDPIGVWALTGQGNRSGHTAIGYLTVLPPED